jgi:GT2 family glycosyltransferase
MPAEKKFPKVIAIVLNWNRPDDTGCCVQSLLQSDYPNLHILVVDNGSQPDLFEKLSRQLTQVEIIRNESTLGFAEGNTRGLRMALEQAADYALVLNNDTVVDSTMVSRLVKVAEKDPSLWLLGPVIYYLDRPEEVWFAGYRFKYNIYVLRRGLRLARPLKEVERVDFVSGCGILIRRSVLTEVGLFSPDYFMYYEDLDLCFRVKAAGFGIACVPDARMWHAVSVSSGGPDSPIKQYYQVKSSIIFYRKYFRGLKFGINITLRFGHAFFILLKNILLNRMSLEAIRMFVRGMKEGWR